MKKNQNIRGKLLWAFNPFQDSPPILKSALSGLQHLSNQSQMTAEPVYVVSPAEVNVVLEFSVPAKERYRSVALTQARKVLKTLKADQLQPIILVVKSLSLTASAKALADYAEDLGAEAILTSVRAKKSLGQSLIGSFSETLLYQARCPVILVHPGCKINEALKRLLYVSDLSPASLEVFENFCHWASVLGAEISLFHSIPRPFSWATFAVDSLLGPDRVSEKQYLILTRKLREEGVRPFAATAKRHGVPFSSTIGIGGEDVSDDALKEARKRKVDLIGMAGKSGRLKTRLLGSISKSLIGQSALPIWIQRCR